MFGSVCISLKRVWRVCSDVRECAAILGSVQRSKVGECTGRFENVQRGLGVYARVYSDFGECAVRFESVQQCLGVCSNVKECAASFGACAASYESVQRG